MRILGVDPGSRLTGYGCIDVVGHTIRLVTHGTLKLLATAKNQKEPSFAERLLAVYQGLSEVILSFRPEVLVVEKVFFAKNAVSALKLGQARGAVLLTGAMHGLPVREYNPTEVKASVVGFGRADKAAVARMVEILVGKQNFSTPDASDAVALAIHHSYCFLYQDKKTPQKKRLSLAESVKHVSKGRI